MDKKISKTSIGLHGEITIPADKSISHRAVMFSSLANGKSIIKNFSTGADPHSTLQIFKDLGVDFNCTNNHLEVLSKGKLKQPNTTLNCNNSGTTMRLISGILSGQCFNSILIGDTSLSARPMKRIIEPLTQMGAKIESNDFKAPLKIYGQELFGINYTTPIASAQVKSAILLAGLFANGQTTVTESYLSRNHTELMLEYMNANIETSNTSTTVEKSTLEPKIFEIPGDISSAAYFMAAALIVPNSKIVLKNVGLNPTRTGIIDIFQQMGADIKILDQKLVCNEIVGDLEINTSELKGCEISGDMIPRLIDEIPIIAVVATQAKGITTIKNAQDLRNKESDRIKATVTELKKLGANIEETSDGMIIYGKTPLIGDTILETYHDHRLAMSLYVAGLICEKEILIKEFEWVDISFPEFESLFNSAL